MKNLSLLNLIIIIALILINSNAFASSSEIIFNKNSKFNLELRFASIKNTTYFYETYSSSAEINYLYQTDGSKEGTFKVKTRNLNDDEVDISNVEQIFAIDENLIILHKSKKIRSISIFDTKQNRLYELQKIDSSMIRVCSLHKFSNNNALIHFSDYGNFPTKIYFIDFNKKELISYNEKYSYIIQKFNDDSIVLRDTVGNLSIVNSTTFKETWQLNFMDLSGFTWFYYSKGINLICKSDFFKSYFVHYSNGKKDTLTTRRIPTHLIAYYPEFDVYRLYLKVGTKNILVKTNSTFQIIDTISKDFHDIQQFNNKVYYYEVSEIVKKYNSSLTILCNLYSYDLISKKKELIVENCLPYQKIKFIHKFNNNKFIMNIYTLEYGSEFYASDGTKDGTMMLKDISKGPESANYFDYIEKVDANQDSSVFYFYAKSSDYGTSIWKTNGTIEETVPLISLEPTEIDIYFKKPNYFITNGKILLQNETYLYAYKIENINKISNSIKYEIFENAFLRESSYDNPSYIYPSSILKDKNENVYVSGYSYIDNSNFAFCFLKDEKIERFKSDFPTIGFVSKYNKNGKKEFTQYLNLNINTGNILLAIDSSSNYYTLVRHHQTGLTGYNYAYLTKQNPVGDSIWNFKFTSLYNDYEINDIEIDVENNVYIAVTIKSGSLEFQNNNVSSFDAMVVLIKINSEGKLLKYEKLSPYSKYQNPNLIISDGLIYLTSTNYNKVSIVGCKEDVFYNFIYTLDYEFNFLNHTTFISDDYCCLNSCLKGFDGDLIIIGNYKRNLIFDKATLKTKKEGTCYAPSSFMVIYDKKLKVKLLKNFNPEKYMINSAYLGNDYSIYTVGYCVDCIIDSLLYPNYFSYPNYSSAIVTKKFDYWGNELENYVYSKKVTAEENLLSPKVIEINNKALIYDVYESNLGFIPESKHLNYVQAMLILKPELNSSGKVHLKDNPKYFISLDEFDKHYIRKNRDIQTLENVDIMIYDLLGKVIAMDTITLINGIQFYELEKEFPKGLYFISIIDHEEVTTTKFMK